MEYLLDELVPRPRQHPASDGTAPPAFTAVLAGLQQWLRTEGFPFVLVGSLACAAWTGQDSLARFSRPGGIIRRKDVIKIAALSGALETGTAVSRFTKRDCAVFAEFVAERDRRYPHYRAFVHLVDELLATAPPSAASSIRYFVMPAAKATVAKMNRTRASAGAR